VLPRLGTFGRVIDLEFLDRVARDAASAFRMEVWLGPAAPADAVERLRAAGLVPGSERTLTGTLEALRQQGTAVALRFHIATGVLALLLAAGAVLLVATVDRADRADELRSLRVQGLRRRDAAVYARRGYLWVVAVAVLAGVAAAVLAWIAIGPFIPQFVDRTPDGTLYWPRPVTLLVPAAASALVLAVAVVLASRSGRTR
jgi:putative ABC transport system permease protein